MHINALSDICGAEVVGFDCGSDFDDATFAAIREAFSDHSVLVFRDQHLTPEQHVAFSKRWGNINGHILTQYLVAGYPELLAVSNKKDDAGQPLGIEDAGRYWHTDVSYEAVPPMGSLLYGLEVPAEGGDTLFASQYRAYENIPADLKDRVASLKARHRFNYVQIQASEDSTRKPLTEEQKKQLVGAVHPVVRTHPETNRKALYVNPGFTESLIDVVENESRALLDTLFGYATDPAVIYRHTWQVRDLVFWDNRCLMHHATPYPADSIRHMHRTTVAGSVPV
ncbi:MAG: TauD/TfdA family dioxygenase [Alphaproteobacteria bacterium]|nr:TauD/TfdA family dioxygenase [Alphaproteobacteria bacterium]